MSFDSLHSIFPSPNPTSGNHKSDLFFCEFVCFWSIIDQQHCISFCYTTWCFGISIHFKMISTIHLLTIGPISSVQSLSRVDSMRPHELQHARPPCPSPTPGVHPNSCPSSRWCHPAISSSVVPFSSCPQSLPAPGSFQWVNSSHEVAKVLDFQLQHQSLQWTPRTDLL